MRKIVRSHDAKYWVSCVENSNAFVCASIWDFQSRNLEEFTSYIFTYLINLRISKWAKTELSRYERANLRGNLNPPIWHFSGHFWCEDGGKNFIFQKRMKCRSGRERTWNLFRLDTVDGNMYSYVIFFSFTLWFVLFRNAELATPTLTPAVWC